MMRLVVLLSVLVPTQALLSEVGLHEEETPIISMDVVFDRMSREEAVAALRLIAETLADKTDPANSASIVKNLDLRFGEMNREQAVAVLNLLQARLEPRQLVKVGESPESLIKGLQLSLGAMNEEEAQAALDLLQVSASQNPQSVIHGLELKFGRMSKEEALAAVKLIEISLGAAGSGPGHLEPQLPGVMPGKDRPKIILAADIDWPPYAYLGVPPESEYDTAGVGHDMAKALSSVCPIDVEVAQTGWSECWTAGKIGAGLLNGHYHGCMTYTHTAGARPRYMEFTDAFLQDNKPAGILTRLDENGAPVVSPSSDLAGKKIVDVGGWAPTADTLALVKNPCTGQYFSGFEMLTPTADGNDAAMTMLMNGEADAMWVYADQAHNYNCENEGITPNWNCSLWSGLGTKFAYIQTGLFGHARNGTTLAISKKGSGLASIINPCLQKLMRTEEYYDICKKHKLESSCYANSFFPNANATKDPWEHPTNDATGDCSSGYCACA